MRYGDFDDHPLFPLGEGLKISPVVRAHDDQSIDDLSGSATELDGEGPTGWRYLGLTVNRARRHAFFAAILLVLAVISLRVGQVQIVQGAHYRNLAEGNRLRQEPIRSERGIIYDRYGTPLVRNVPNFAATLTPASLPEDESSRLQLIGELAAAVGLMPDDIERRLVDAARRPTDPAVMAERLDHQRAVLVEIMASRWPAVGLDVGTRREYLTSAEAPSLSHVLGYDSRITETEVAQYPSYLVNDRVGKTGVEKSYETDLRGTYGHREVEIDARGQRKEVIVEEPAIAGAGLHLSIDLKLQEAAESALQQQLQLSRKRRGSVIALNPKTGEILALVNEPSFDNNLFAIGISGNDYRTIVNDPDRPLFPRAWAAALPAGSTFKPVVAAAALEEGTVTPRTTVMSTGGINYGVWQFPDWKAGGHGLTDVYKALAESVNTYFYAIGGGWGSIEGLGMERIVDYATKFGFGEKTGIDLPGEGAGFLPNKEWKLEAQGRKWLIGDTYHLAIGQGDLLVTPLQIAVMTAVFANGGDLIRPHVVNSIIKADGKTTALSTEIIATQVVSASTIEAVRRGMRQTVTAGSARWLSDLSQPVAAKTGTAQWSSSKPTHAWFTSFGPYDDPSIVVTVVIEEGGEGSSAAAPVAKKVYEAYFGK